MAASNLIITNVGLATANAATPEGPWVHITGFRIGSAYGYDPAKIPFDTDLDGNLLYSGVPLSYTPMSDGSIVILVRIPAEAGPWEWGEIGLYNSADGGVTETLFAKAVFDEPVMKYSSLGTNVASSSTFRCRLKLDQASAIFKVDTMVTLADGDTTTVSGLGTVDEPFVTEVKISPDDENRLEIRDNGIGVWDTSPPDLRFQYVSWSLGNDNNPGTKALPLKSMYQALERIRSGSAGVGTFYIMFRAGETHQVNRELPPTPNADLRIGWYDDPLYQDYISDRCPGYYTFFAPDLQRPLLDFQLFSKDDYTACPSILCKNVIAQGVNLRGPTVFPSYPGTPKYIMEVTTQAVFSGSDIRVRAAGMYALRTPAAVLQGVVVAITAGMFLEPGIYNSLTSASSGAGTYSCPGWPSFNGRPGNAITALTLANHGGNYYAPTKTQFGWATSWDIFG